MTYISPIFVILQFLFLMVYLNDSTRILFIFAQKIVLDGSGGSWDWLHSTARSLGHLPPWTGPLGSLTGAGG